MTILEGDTIKLHPKTGKGKQVIHRDGCLDQFIGCTDFFQNYPGPHCCAPKCIK